MVTYLDRVSMGTIAPIVTKEWQLTPSQTGLDLQLVCTGLRAVRDPDREVGRKARHQIGPHSHRAVVVCVHRGDGAGLQPPVDAASCGSCSAPARRARGRGWRGRFRAGFPRLERGTVQGIFFAGAHLVGGLTPPLIGADAASSELAHDLRRLRSGRLGLGRGLAVVVPRTIRRTSRGQRRRARAHPARPSTRQQTHGRPRVLGPLVLQPQRRAAVPDVSVEQHDLLLLHHLAADVSQEPAWLRCDHAWFSLRPPAAGQRAERSVRRHG